MFVCFLIEQLPFISGHWDLDPAGMNLEYMHWSTDSLLLHTTVSPLSKLTGRIEWLNVLSKEVGASYDLGVLLKHPLKIYTWILKITEYHLDYKAIVKKGK